MSSLICSYRLQNIKDFKFHQYTQFIQQNWIFHIMLNNKYPNSFFYITQKSHVHITIHIHYMYVYLNMCVKSFNLTQIHIVVFVLYITVYTGKNILLH